tara:strand:+ start:250 stop:1857 length:1608 start_codon:yes stop_codon:yes gene_type:complete
MMFVRSISCIIFVLLIAASPPTVAANYWPTDGWRNSTPEEQGMDSGQLADLVEDIQKSGKRVDSVTVIRNGYVVLNSYFYPFEKDLKHILHSVTKSITSTLVGIAIDRGEIRSISQPVLEFFPNRTIANVDKRKRSMTLEHLLTMTSGFDCSDSYRHRWKGLWDMRRSPDWTQHVLNLPMREAPGQNFDYCNGVSFLLSAIIEKATGKQALDYAKTSLFGPLGITDVRWPASPRGTTVGWGEMWLKPHDMAKLGWLYLNKGMWDGVQIVSSKWVEEATDTRVTAGLFAGYGYQWWRDSDYYAALGYAGQLIFVVPSKNMVVVFTGDLPGGQLYVPRDLLEEYVIPAARSEAGLPANPEQQARLRLLVEGSAKSSRFIWSSARAGIAENGLFVRRASPAFQFRFPRGSRRETVGVPGQVMEMKTLSGFRFDAGVMDIPKGIALGELGPERYARFLEDVSGTRIKVVSNEPMVLTDGTPAYRTEIHWRYAASLDLKTIVMSAIKEEKWVLVAAHPWEDFTHAEASKIVETLSFEVTN